MVDNSAIQSEDTSNEQSSSHLCESSSLTRLNLSDNDEEHANIDPFSRPMDCDRECFFGTIPSKKRSFLSKRWGPKKMAKFQC